MNSNLIHPSSSLPGGKPNMSRPVTGTLLVDDIDCVAWLLEVDLEQYTETFLVNFTRGGRYLSRKRLGQVRLQDFPHMNITNFDHQKILMQHIRSSLRHSFNSKARKQEAKAIHDLNSPKKKLSSNKKPILPPIENINVKFVAKVVEKPVDKKTSSNRRRHSFDETAWAVINKSRGALVQIVSDANKLRMNQLDAITDTLEKVKPQRRVTFDPDDRSSDGRPPVKHEIHKGIVYGNLALKFNISQKQMENLNETYLAQVKTTVGCERATAMFLNSKTSELVFFANKRWYRLSDNFGVAGNTASTGDNVNISDSNDERIKEDKNIEKMVVWKPTRNALCQPIRVNRGGGSVVGVIQLTNKNDHDGNPVDFDNTDEDLLASCILSVAEELSSKFGELLDLSESISPFATPILGNQRRRSLSEETMASANRAIVRTGSASKTDNGFRPSLDNNQRLAEAEKLQRRQSFGRDLNEEISANPDLLHVRK